LLLLLSHASMNSEWVKTEIAKARKREIRENRRMLFPVRLVDFRPLRDWECFDADHGKDLAVEVREYFIPDFTVVSGSGCRGFYRWVGWSSRTRLAKTDRPRTTHAHGRPQPLLLPEPRLPALR